MAKPFGQPGPLQILCDTCKRRVAMWQKLDKSGKHVYRCECGAENLHYRSQANTLESALLAAMENGKVTA